jgi:Zn-dependent protease
MLVAALVPSVILHEVAHGVVALRFGDDTAKRAGRLTLNPVPHVDPFGTVLLPLLLALSGVGIIGWAKPVPVSAARLRDPRRQLLWVSLAGPATNLVIALAAALALRAVEPSGDVRLALVVVGTINVVLAVFNMLPVPPFDGSAVVERFLPTRLLPGWLRLRRWSFGVVLLIVLAAPRFLDTLFRWAIERWSDLL